MSYWKNRHETISSIKLAGWTRASAEDAEALEKASRATSTGYRVEVGFFNELSGEPASDARVEQVLGLSSSSRADRTKYIKRNAGGIITHIHVSDKGFEYVFLNQQD
jgi:hypothetical protein